MLHLTIICLGKLKEKYWQEAEAEYLKRLTPFVKIIIKEIKEESFKDINQADTIKTKEAEKIIHALPKEKNHIIALDSQGQQFTSEIFAQQIFNQPTSTGNNIVFIIGGPLGLDKSILKLADQVISFSHMTFTHQMIKIFLLEQLYRSTMIISNRQYHY